MRTLVSILLGLAILAGAGGAVYMLVLNKPVAQKVERLRTETSVKVLIATKHDVTLPVPSQGLVNAIRSTTLAAQVAGRVEKVTRFKVGERFANDEILIELDRAVADVERVVPVLPADFLSDCGFPAGCPALAH